MYYLSDTRAEFGLWDRKKRQEQPPTYGQIGGNAINTGINNAGKAFVGLAVTARATPQRLMRWQLTQHQNPIMNRVVGEGSIFGNIRQQTLDHLKNQGVDTRPLQSVTGGRKLRDAVRQTYNNLAQQGGKQRGLMPLALNQNLPLQGKLAGAVGLGTAGYALGRGLYERHKQNKLNRGI